MRKFFLLIKMLAYGLLGINKAIHSRDKKQRRQVISFAAAWAVMILCAVALSLSTAIGCARMGAADSLPALMLLYCSMITLVLTFMESNGMIIGIKDYDAIMSLPVAGSVVIASRVTFVYLLNLALAAIVMLPAAFVFGSAVGADATVYLMLLTAPLFAPLIPMVAALTFGSLITAAAVRFKYRNVVSIVLSVAATLTILVLSMSFNGDVDELADFGRSLSAAVNKTYPIAGLLSKAVNKNDAASYAVFASVSVAAIIVFVAVLNRFYAKINAAVFSYYRKNDYRVGTLKTSSPFMALYKKEMRRLATCTIYALNQCFGAVLFIVAGAALLAAGPARMAAELELGDLLNDYMHCVPFVMALIVGMTSTTCVSLSLEGKYRWIVCSVPVGAKTVFDSKIAVHLSVFLPACAIGAPLWIAALIPDVTQAAFMLLIPVVYTFFVAVAGMYLNVRYPRYDWASEYYCVKGGSASLMLSLAVSFGATIGPLILCAMMPAYGVALQALVTAAVAAVTLVLYRKLNGVRLYA